MEICDSDEEETHSPKLHSKKNILYRLISQKKDTSRCESPEMKDSNLQTDLSDSPEKVAVGPGHKPSPIHSQSLLEDESLALNYIDNEDNAGVRDENIGNKYDINESMKRGTSPNDCHNTTNLTLCCAMTESSKSSDQPHSGYERNTLESSHNRNSGTDSSNTEVRKSRSITRKSTSLDDSTEGLRFEKCRLSSSRSPTPSEASSGNSSPAPGSSSSRFRRRLLSQRLSVDNLVVASPPSSLRHSSPESAKSMPESRFQKRSTSHDTMIPKKQSQEEETTADANTKGKGLIASMESLAHNSLLAAQVLHLIPTTKARERNFLHGRIAANSLLGSFELERTLPNRELKIFVGTWNMNGQSPPKVLNDFMLPEGLEHVPDMLAVGTQESFSERFEWEVSIQETIGPSHLLFHSAVLGTLHLAVFIRRDLLWFCSVPEDASYSVRPGTAFRTKGAVAIGFMLFGTSYLFITSHLTAHMDKAKERVHDIKRIVRSLDLPKLLPNRHRSKDVTSNYDCVFWCGDLNFRLDQVHEEVMQWVTKQEFPLSTPFNLCNDQLTTIIADGSIFRGFEEGPIKFPPTYKYDPGTQNYDTSHKQRTPAYTDRILFKWRGRRESSSTGAGNLVCLMYESVASICTSDHKPVWGVYKSIVRPGIDTIPLAAGLFNRDVFLEGIKRRAAAMTKMHDASTVCQIQ